MRIRIPAFLGKKLYLKYMNCKCLFMIIKNNKISPEMVEKYYWDIGKVWKIQK